MSQSRKIRAASPSDAEFLESCTAKAYSKYIPALGRKPQPMTADYADLVNTGHVWVLEDGKERAGLLVLEFTEKNLLIYSIAVDPSYQRQGHGQALMRFAEEEALRRHYSCVQLYTNEHMQDNIRWYQRLGYAETRREKYKGSSLVYMEKVPGTGT